MTTGALIFAFNNERTDYVKMAAWSAERIRHYLKIPVTLVTDATDPGLADQFDEVRRVAAQTGGTRYFEDYADTVSWHNAGRTDAYSLTPYDQTLVLDSDYVVCGNQLEQVLSAPQDFLAHRTAFNVTRPEEKFLDTFGRNEFPMWWATVMMFRKGPTAQYIFDSMAMIKDNYEHYRNLYGIAERNYRNDYALSIALGIASINITVPYLVGLWTEGIMALPSVVIGEWAMAILKILAGFIGLCANFYLFKVLVDWIVVLE